MLFDSSPYTILFACTDRLLTNEPQVEANAIAIINGIPDTLRMMLAIANDRSPKCSTNRKNMNQVDKETKF